MMKKQLLRKATLVAMLIWAVGAIRAAVPYDITFAGRGEATTVESVTVENLTQNTSLALNGTDILRLVDKTAVGIEAATGITLTEPVLYPNPAYGKGTLVFDATDGGNVVITINDPSGRMLNVADFNVIAGRYSVSLPAMPSGMYIVGIRGAGVKHGFNWMCAGDGSGAGSITLNGTTTEELPVVKTRAQQANDVQVVEMQYNEGDLLRFTGTNGDMRTIAMNIPTCSHDILFDFFPCTDAAGNHYTVVRAGDLLWMAEDLRHAGSKKALLMEDADMWKQYNTQAIAAHYGFDDSNAAQGAYYTPQGALAALPEGWSLPTAGEVDYMVKALGGYATAADRLKTRSSESLWQTSGTGADSISFGAQPYGYLTPDGTFETYGSNIRYLTRSTQNGKYISFELADNGQLVLDTKTAPESAGYGFHVRGCRQAPSAYSGMMKLFGANSASEASAKNVAKRAKAFAEGPLGNSYTLAMEHKKLFMNNTTDHKLNFYNYNGSSKSFTASSTMLTNTGYDYLQKAAAQNNPNGYERLVVARFNRKIEKSAWTNYAYTNSLEGEGTITLTIYGDSTENYRQMKTLTTQAKFTMQHYSLATGITNSPDAYTRQFYLVCADFNKDGTDDIAVSLGNRVEVYDGATLTLLSSKNFESQYGIQPVSIAAGNIDDDVIPDLVVTSKYKSPKAGEAQGFYLYKYSIQVYKGGDLTAEDPYLYMGDILSAEKAFINDIKVGDVTGDGKDNIVFLNADYSSGNIRENVQAFEYEYEPSFGGRLKEIYYGSAFTYSGGENRTVTLVHTRGAMYPADILCGGGITRYNDRTEKFDNTEIKLPYGAHIPSGCIVAANFDNNEEGKEQVLYIAFDDRTSSTYNTSAHLYLWDSAKSTSTLVKADVANYYYKKDGNSYEEQLQFPFLAAARSAEQTKILQYRKHITTMSEPRIYALLAAPPYYKEKADGTPYEYAYDFGTSWGKSTTTGGGSENSSSHKATVIFGYEQEFTLPIVAKKVGGVDFETKLEMEWTSSTEREETITKSNEFTTVNDDGVILNAIFYDTYTYEITRSGNPDEVGTNLIISIPLQPRTMMITMSDYNRLTADSKEIPYLRNVFRHTVGKPFTYPSEVDQIRTNVPGTPIYWGGAFGGDDFMSTGSGGMLNRSIVLDRTTAASSGFTFSMDVELVATAMGVKAGAGYGYDNSNKSTHIEGEGHSIAGSVAGLRKLGEAGLADFRWNVCWYQYQVGGQTFPVVYYVVKE